VLVGISTVEVLVGNSEYCSGHSWVFISRMGAGVRVL